MDPSTDREHGVPPGIEVRTAALADGCMGLWDEAARTVWLDPGLTPAERRSTLAHELVHAERGDLPCDDPALDARQERRVEGEAARRLIPLPRLVEAARWTPHLAEVADLLDVDPGLLRARLDGLTPTERALVDRAVERENPQAAP